MQKRIFYVFLLLFAPTIVNSQTGGNQPVAPNKYQLSGGRMHIIYTTTDTAGQPHLSYEDGTRTLSFTGNEIRQAKTEMGTLVSVTIRRTIDTGSTTFTLLVPTVNLAGPSSSAQVKTYGITTVHKFSGVPAANRGQTELYTTTELSGTASLVLIFSSLYSIPKPAYPKGSGVRDLPRRCFA